jgi:hypothetical protein
MFIRYVVSAISLRLACMGAAGQSVCQRDVVPTTPLHVPPHASATVGVENLCV